MSLYDDASLIMFPSGYKEDKIYSLKPTDGSGDLTFTRASTATRVNSQGLIEKVRTNLLVQSNGFDTAAWPNDDSTETSGQAGYDGTNNAWLLTKTGTNGRISQIITTSGLQTFSAFVKAGTDTFVKLEVGGTNTFAFFNLTTGAVGTTGAGLISAQISAQGNGFFRCSITFNATIGFLNMWVADADNDTTEASGNIFIQNAQLETGDIATPYIPTTSAAVSVGPVANIPRIDYTGGGCGKLLLEPQRTNLVTFSEQFDNAAWSKEDLSVTANNAVSPDGFINADLLVPNTSTIDHTIYQLATAAVSQTFSVFAKAGGYNFIFLGANNGTASDGVFFDLTNGTISQNTSVFTAKIESYGNGWYRCSISAASWPLIYAIICTSANGTSFIHAGNGTSGVLTYGAQLELGSYPTSYIPTLGASVTRSADSASKTGISSLIGQSEGVLYAEAKTLSQGITEKIISISDGTAANVIYFSYSAGAGNQIFYVIVAGGVLQSALSVAVSQIVTNKIAIKYKANDCSFWLNGTKIHQVNSANMPTGLSVIQTTYPTVPYDFEGDINSLLLYPTALSDAQLQELTTL